MFECRVLCIVYCVVLCCVLLLLFSTAAVWLLFVLCSCCSSLVCVLLCTVRCVKCAGVVLCLLCTVCCALMRCGVCCVLCDSFSPHSYRSSTPPNQPSFPVYKLHESQTISHSLDVVGQPAEALAIAAPLHNAAHEELHRPDAVQALLALAGGQVVQAKIDTQLILRRSAA